MKVLISKQFKKSAIVSLIIGLLFIIWGIVQFLLTQDIFESFATGSFGVIFIGLAIVYFNKKKNADATVQQQEFLEEDNLTKYHDFVLNTEVSWYKQQIIYSTEGTFLGRYQPDVSKFINFFKANISFLIKNLPCDYIVKDTDEKTIFSMKAQGFFQPVFTVYDDKGNEIGSIKQHIFKSAFNYTFVIEAAEETFEAKSDTLTRDMRIKGLLHCDSYKVPLELTKIFKTIAPIQYTLEHDLQSAKGKVALAFACVYNSLQR